MTPDARKAPVDYSSLTVAQLKALLDEREITYPSNAKRQDLIDLLEG
ncbi:HeH/LEM domain-containing protein [Enterococcus sp. AZ189]